MKPFDWQADDPQVVTGYTSHGHAIAGLEQTGDPPPHRARCGGPGICSTCSRDVAAQVNASPSMLGVGVTVTEDGRIHGRLREGGIVPIDRPVVW